MRRCRGRIETPQGSIGLLAVRADQWVSSGGGSSAHTYSRKSLLNNSAIAAVPELVVIPGREKFVTGTAT